MKSKFIFTLLIFSLTGLSSCKKDEDPHKESVHIDFNSIVEHTMYGLGDTILMKGTITCSVELHGYNLEIFNLSSGDTVLFEKHVHDHATSYHFDEFWINNVDNHSDMLFRLTVFTDHDSENIVKDVAFHCHPM